MAYDRQQVEQLAARYSEAWSSRDAARVAAHCAPDGVIAVNGGEPAAIAEVATAFITAFPDIEVTMDDLVFKDDVVEYHWTFTGTSAETGNRVRIPGFEEWRIGADGLIAESRGRYDQAEYDRELREGARRPFATVTVTRRTGSAAADRHDQAALVQESRRLG